MSSYRNLTLDELTSAISQARAKGDHKAWRLYLDEYQVRTRITDFAPWTPLLPPPASSRPPRQLTQKKDRKSAR